MGKYGSAISDLCPLTCPSWEIQKQMAVRITQMIVLLFSIGTKKRRPSEEAPHDSLIKSCQGTGS